MCFSVYVKEDADFKVVSHSEQMAKSRCYLEGAHVVRDLSRSA